LALQLGAKKSGLGGKKRGLGAKKVAKTKFDASQNKAKAQV